MVHLGRSARARALVLAVVITGVFGSLHDWVNYVTNNLKSKWRLEERLEDEDETTIW